MTSDGQIQEALALAVAYREGILPAFEQFVTASEHIERWLENGSHTDPETVREVGPHVFDALRALSLIGYEARRVTDAVARVTDGLKTDTRELN